MTTKDSKIADSLILLDIQDVCKYTGWCENTVRKMFADDEFPVIKYGKKQLVALEALKTFFMSRREKKD